MSGCIIEINEDGRHLSLSKGFLLVNFDEKIILKTPLDEIASIIINCYQLTYSHAVLLELIKRNIIFIACSNNHLPAAIFWPVESHYHQCLIMQAQVKASSLNKELWKIIVHAKILNQQRLLEKVGINGGSLIELSKGIIAGDPKNHEAQAARQYWPLLLGKRFIREPGGGGVNPLLNYGYSIIRSGMARAIMGAGLHPTFGIFHGNRLNPMCLVDDLMEPYRPIIDWEVYKLDRIGAHELSKEIKTKLAGILTAKCIFNGHKVSISMAMQYSAQSLSLCYKHNDNTKLQLPERLIPLAI